MVIQNTVKYLCSPWQQLPQYLLGCTVLSPFLCPDILCRCIRLFQGDKYDFEQYILCLSLWYNLWISMGIISHIIISYHIITVIIIIIVIMKIMQKFALHDTTHFMHSAVKSVKLKCTLTLRLHKIIENGSKGGNTKVIFYSDTFQRPAHWTDFTGDD